MLIPRTNQVLDVQEIPPIQARILWLHRFLHANARASLPCSQTPMMASGEKNIPQSRHANLRYGHLLDDP